MTHGPVSAFPRQSAEGVTTKTGFNTRGENLSIDESMGKLLGEKVIPQILDAGLNLDFIDADAIDALGIQYPVLVLPGVNRLPVSTYRRSSSMRCMEALSSPRAACLQPRRDS